MSNIYKSQIDSTKKLLSSKGQLIALTRRTALSYDPLNPDTTGVNEMDGGSAPGVVLTGSIPGFFRFDDHAIIDPNVRQSTRYILLSPVGLTFRPRVGDYITTTEGQGLINGLIPLDPAGQGAIIFYISCTLT